LQQQGRGHVGFFSLEMSGEQLWQRVISDASGIPSWRIKRRALSENEITRLANLERDLRKLPIKIDQTGKLSIAQLELRARALKKRRGLDLLVIDYVQLLAGRQRKAREDNRMQELSDITSSLKNLAKELNVPILALAQLSRAADQRTGDDRRPKLSDLRESGSLEQDADMVMLIYREEYYLKDEKPRNGGSSLYEWERRMVKAKGVAEVIIAKQRHGPPSILTMGFNAELTRFLNEPEPREELPEQEEKRAKKKELTGREAVTAIGLLRNLTLVASVENDGTLEGVPRGVKPVPYVLWRRKCAESLLDPEQGEKEALALMRTKVLPALMEVEFIGRGGPNDAHYVWVTERGK
jgi:replicative DNA helicase